MFMLGAYPAPVLRWRQGPVMSGFLTFMDRYRDEAACIAALAELRWPNGFICARCAGRLAYQLAARPRVFECADCGRQHSVTAGTVFHRTRTPHSGLLQLLPQPPLSQVPGRGGERLACRLAGAIEKPRELLVGHQARQLADQR